MAWVQRYSTGQLVAAVLVFFALLAVAIPSNLKSNRKSKHKSIIKFIQAFQDAACKLQNSNPSLRFFTDEDDIVDHEFPFEKNKFEYNFYYLTDKSLLRFVFLALPDEDNSDNWAFYGDETGTVYTIELSEAGLNKYRNNEIDDIVDFNKNLDKRLPHSWIPY